MIAMVQLWLPVLVSSVGVFVASSLIHMVFKYHNADYDALPDEGRVAEALRGVAAGQYVLPYCKDMQSLKAPEMQKRFAEGPIGYLTLRPAGAPNMGKHLGQWFLLTVFVSLIAAGVAGAALPAGASRHLVFHTTGLLVFAAYACGSLSGGIWKGQTWTSVLRDLLDALIYGAVTGGCFALLWPH